MAITTQDGLVAGIGAAASNAMPIFNKATVSVANTFYSDWVAAGWPVAGAAAGSINGRIPDRTTTGAFPLTNAAGGKNNYLAYLRILSAAVGTFYVYDRLWDDSGASGTNTGSNAVTQPSLTRYTGGDNNQLWVECYTALGATPQTLTVTYTNQAGTASRSGTASIPANMAAGRMVPVTLQAGDTGVRSVQSFQLGGSTGAAGNYGLTMLQPLVEVGLPLANVSVVLDWFSMGGVPVQTDACLAMMFLPTSTTTGLKSGRLTVASD